LGRAGAIKPRFLSEGADPDASFDAEFTISNSTLIVAQTARAVRRCGA
jgi:hypothetical protein